MRVRALKDCKVVFQGKAYSFHRGDVVDVPETLGLKLLQNPRLSRIFREEPGFDHAEG
ncbi:MAG: hypothetical protein ACXQTV_00015 [Candidatus Hecatellaceae archaeon]